MDTTGSETHKKKLNNIKSLDHPKKRDKEKRMDDRRKPRHDELGTKKNAKIRQRI